MKLAVTRQLFEYWNDLRRERAAPERSEVDPGALSGVLSDTFILDFDKPAQFPFRIVGTRTVSMIGRELRKEPFVRLWRASDQDEIVHVLSAVADETRPFIVNGMGGPSGVQAIDFEVLLLPLRHKGMARSRILGSISSRSAPNWLGLLPVGNIALTVLQGLAPTTFTAPRYAG